MLIFFVLVFNSAFGANILYVSPVVSHSHHIWNRVLALGLNKKGHNVTMLSHNDEKTKPKNFHLILLEGVYDKEFEDFTIDAASQANPVKGIKVLYDFSKFSCEHDFGTKGLATLMNYPKDYKFDLIVIDITLQACLYPIIDRFNNPPVVGVTPFLLPPVILQALGNPLETSYMPYYSTLFTNKMSFKERFINFCLIYAESLYRTYISFPEELTMARNYFGEHTRALNEIERNISILLANTDPNFEYPLDLPPNVIPVGGLQIQPAKPLPDDLKQIVDNAKTGIIVFSLGSHLRSDQLSEDKRRIILSAFARLSQTVIWKFETDSIPDLPKNVILRKWLPQSDLLAQPNTKLLINHGGALSTQEAMYYGIPVVAIPFFTDQFTNAGRLKNKNMAKVINFNSMTTENFYETVIEVLNNPMYRDNIETVSKRYHDKMNTPLETAIFWVEYILRHGGGEHLNLAARDLSFIQTSNIDIYVVLILGIYLIYSVICLLFSCSKLIYRTLFKTTS